MWPARSRVLRSYVRPWLGTAMGRGVDCQNLRQCRVGVVLVRPVPVDRGPVGQVPKLGGPSQPLRAPQRPRRHPWRCRSRRCGERRCPAPSSRSCSDCITPSSRQRGLAADPTDLGGRTQTPMAFAQRTWTQRAVGLATRNAWVVQAPESLGGAAHMRGPRATRSPRRVNFLGHWRDHLSRRGDGE